MNVDTKGNSSGGKDDCTAMPITPFSNSIQTPAVGSVSTCIRSRNISREELLATEMVQNSALNDYELHRPKSQTLTEYFGAEFVRNPDGTPLLDHENKPITIAKMLATKPLKSELHSRPGPGNRKLTYLSGDSVTRTLNDIFGFDGWCLEVKETRRECCEKDSKDRYCVSYTSLVRVTHRQSGAFKEDCGAGDCVDRSLGTAISHALKASVTDAMKRAVRHFGDKLGNSLYESSFNMNNAPKSLKDALIMYEIERAKCKFGFEKDRVKVETNEDLLASAKETTLRGTSSAPQDATKQSAARENFMKENTANHLPKVPNIAGPSSTAHTVYQARNSTNTGTQDHGGSDRYISNINNGHVRHQVTNTYKTGEMSNHASSINPMHSASSAITSSISSSGPTIKNEAIYQRHNFVTNPSSMTTNSNISPNGIKRFQSTNVATQKNSGTNHSVGSSAQPVSLNVQNPSLPISNNSRCNDSQASSYTRNVLSDVTNASNNRPIVSHGPINNHHHYLNNAKRPMQDDQENGELPGSKKVITATYNMPNPYMTTKK